MAITNVIAGEVITAVKNNEIIDKSNQTFDEITSTTFVGGQLTNLTADGVAHTITYESGKIKSVSNGTNTWTIDYSNLNITKT